MPENHSPTQTLLLPGHDPSTLYCEPRYANLSTSVFIISSH